MKLAAWYRLLLLAFPRYYRRSRGEEMLGTLLDGARLDQTRPSWREAASVTGSGLRCRIRLRPGAGTLAAAVAASVTGAILTATFLAWAAWMLAAPPLPSQREADALAHSLVTLQPQYQERFDFVFGDNGYDLGVAGYIEYHYDDVPESMLATARETLRANGWTLDGHSARKDTVSLALHSTSLWITRTQPGLVPWLTVLGAFLGAYGGWTLAARVSRRVAKRSPIVLAATMTLSGASFLTLFPACAYALLQFSGGYSYGAPWIALYWDPLRTLTFIGLFCGIAVIALSSFSSSVQSVAFEHSGNTQDTAP